MTGPPGDDEARRPARRPARRRRHARMRLDAVPEAGSVSRAARRVGEREREAAAALLARASRAGRFGASDLYERRMEELVTARTQSDIDRLTGDLDELVTGKIRTRMLRVIAKARAEGRLEFAEFCERTDRCLEPVTRTRANGLVGDLGYRVVRPGRRRHSWEPAARRVALAGLVGGVAGTALVVVPSALDLPGGVGQWLPLAVGTGVFSAIGSGLASLAWLVRPSREAAKIASARHARVADPRPPHGRQHPPHHGPPPRRP